MAWLGLTWQLIGLALPWALRLDLVELDLLVLGPALGVESLYYSDEEVRLSGATIWSRVISKCDKLN